MTHEELSALRPLALGHDQDASYCPWACLTHRTAEYPSRRAQLAIALAASALPPTPDVVELMYRCDDCGQCRARSILPNPPDLARSLWPLRAMLVEQAAVPELDAWQAALRRHGHIYGDLIEAWSGLGPGDAGADTLFVPDGAVLAYQPEAASAALQVTRRLVGRVALLTQVPDSGQVLRELGLASNADTAQGAIRRHIEQAAPRTVMAGTPKEAAALAQLLAGLPVRVVYAATALAQAVLESRFPWPPAPADGRRVVLHASAALLHSLPDYPLIEQWLAGWLGDTFCREPDPRRQAWPAAVERPAIGLSPALAQRLALARLERLMKLEPQVILTCDPFSLRALRAVAPAGVDVQDLLTFCAAVGFGD